MFLFFLEKKAMPGLHEVCGLELIERISKESFKKKEIATRVWSSSLECWGFFDANPNNLDKIMEIGRAHV